MTGLRRATRENLVTTLLGSSAASERHAAKVATLDAQIAMVDLLLAQLPAAPEPRFTTSESDEMFSLAEMLTANAEHEDVCSAVRALAIGEMYVDTITIVRVS